MIEVLEFVFRSFWTWLGTVIFVAVVVTPFKYLFTASS